jgi:hypothetical protein
MNQYNLKKAIHAGNKNIRLEGDIMREHNYSNSYFSQPQD